MKEFLATRIDPDEEAGEEMEEKEKEDEWVKEEENEDYDEDKWVTEEEENDFLLPDTFLSPPLGDVVVGEIYTLPSLGYHF